MQIKKRIIMALMVGVLLTSCAGQATGEPTVDMNTVMTEGVGTFVAGLTQTQAAQPKTATPSPSPTWTVSPVSLNSVTPSTATQAFVLPLSTIFVSPTGTQYTATANPSGLAVGCNNLHLIRDETIPAGTIMNPGEVFTKIWKVENNGTCDWVYLYGLVFVGGDRMEGEPSGPNNIIPPGKWTQVSVGMAAPSDPGTYTGNWRMANQAGTPFGATLTVSIVVAYPTDTPVPATATPTATPTTPVP